MDGPSKDAAKEKLELLQSTIKGFPKLVQPFRVAVFDGPLLLRISGEYEMEEQELHFFLFNDIVIYAKRKTSRTYKFKGQFPIRDLFLQIMNEPNSFSIRYVNRVYIFTAQTPELRETWENHFHHTLASANKNRVFGTPLEIYMQTEDPKNLVPKFIDQSINFLMKYALNVEGLFRIPCSIADLQILKETINLGLHKDFDKTIDPNLVAGLLRSYLNELPESVPSYDTVDQLQSIPKNLELPELIFEIRAILPRIPTHNFHLTKALILFLKKIADNSQVNKMTPRNLALIFAPSFLKRRNTIFDCQNSSYDLLTFLITHGEKIFAE